MKLDTLVWHKIRLVIVTIILWIIALRTLLIIIYFGAENSFSLMDSESKALMIITRDLTNISLVGFIIGSLTGFNELFIFPKMFKNKPVYKLLLAKIVVFLISIIIATIITLYIYECQYKGKSFNEYLIFMKSHFFSRTFLIITAVGLLISMGINLILFIRNKLGYGIAFPILIGRYHNPREEDRIFIFIDLKSSVEIAEKLTPINYSKFLQDCFKDLEEVVIKHRGIIYQFVGDECVITWKIKKKTNFNHPIRLFYEYKNLLLERNSHYEETYGIVPKFKGAIHSGVVSTAEVGGDIKSEIAFHGDVLNTTARVMELCKKFNEDLLITDVMLKRTKLLPGEFKITSKDIVELRGKHIKHKICAVREVEEITNSQN
jgi:adenylate cyclase